MIKTGIYRHYKGNLYVVEHIALHTETCEDMVVYHDYYLPDKVYVRPACMFAETVFVEGVWIKRFEYIGREIVNF